MTRDLEHQLRDAARVEPDAALRARVLAAAMPLVAPDAHWLDGVWSSRRWRLAAALAVLAIVGAEWTLRPGAAGGALAGAGRGDLASVARTTEAAAVTAEAARRVGLNDAFAAVVVAQAIEAQRPSAGAPDSVMR